MTMPMTVYRYCDYAGPLPTHTYRPPPQNGGKNDKRGHTWSSNNDVIVLDMYVVRTSEPKHARSHLVLNAHAGGETLGAEALQVS